MLTPQSLLSAIHRQKYTTLKSLSEDVQKIAKRMGINMSMSHAYELTRTNLFYLEQQHKIKRSNKGKTFYISSKRYKAAMEELKKMLLKHIGKGENTPSQLKGAYLTPCKKRVGISLISQLLHELEKEGKIKREGSLAKGRSKIYLLTDKAGNTPPSNEERQAQACILSCVYRLSARQPYSTAQEISRKSSVDLEQTRKQLKKLHECGLLNEKSVGFLHLYQIHPQAAERLETLEWNITFDAQAEEAFTHIPQPENSARAYAGLNSLAIHPALLSRGKNRQRENQQSTETGFFLHTFATEQKECLHNTVRILIPLIPSALAPPG